ncbi:MAG TPA: FGGY family carbohydrate kinase, partial [Dongiaceae bacterium]
MITATFAASAAPASIAIAIAATTLASPRAIEPFDISSPLISRIARLSRPGANAPPVRIRKTIEEATSKKKVSGPAEENGLAAATLIGIDIGTTAVKAILIDVAGKTLASFAESYPTARPAPDQVEQNPEDWLTGVLAALT